MIFLTYSHVEDRLKFDDPQGEPKCAYKCPDQISLILGGSQEYKVSNSIAVFCHYHDSSAV